MKGVPKSTLAFDPTSVVAVLVTICDTFDLDSRQMIALRKRLETVQRGQPKPIAKKHTQPPVSLQGLAIAAGLLLGFGATHREVIKIDRAVLIALGREYDPYA